MPNGPIEPNAQIRDLAIKAFELYTAFVQAGFAEDQALDLTYRIIK